MTQCPFCGRDPFHYVDNGLGMEPVAVACCELGDLYFRGARQPIDHDIVIGPDEFRALGDSISDMRAVLSAYQLAFGDLPLANE